VPVRFPHYTRAAVLRGHSPCTLWRLINPRQALFGSGATIDGNVSRSLTGVANIDRSRQQIVQILRNDAG